VANKRKKPDPSGGLLDGTRRDDDLDFVEPLHVALVTRAAGNEVGRDDAADRGETTRPRPGAVSRPWFTDTGRRPARTPENLSIEIDLPPLPKGDIPEEDAAVRIDDVTVDPGTVPLASVPGLPDDAYAHDGQLTKRDVRAVTLARLSPEAVFESYSPTVSSTRSG